jgi:hypothetical protein
MGSKQFTRFITHLHAVQQDLNHDESGSLESNSSTLGDESDHFKVQFSVRGHGTTERDHLEGESSVTFRDTD